jgi:SAM-dependent methyltransferase
MRSVPYRMWADYYLLLLANLEKRPIRVLDVCCGTGSVSELLADEGFKVTGIDLSEPMVAKARDKALAKGLDIRYEAANASDFELGERFEGAYSFFDSLNYIADPSLFSQALKAVARHLEPGASFVFDLNTAYAYEQRMFDQSHLRPQSRLRYDWKGDWDPRSRLIRVAMTFWHGERRFEEVHVQRAYSDEEVRGMLDAAGFGHVRAYHSYTLDPPRRTSDRVHYLAILE